MIVNKRIPILYILEKIKEDALVAAILTIGISLFTEHVYTVPIPIQIPAFFGTAITLALAFKLNQSYDRWWEARKIWGAIVNDSRTLVLQAKNFTNGSAQEEVKKIGYRQIAWCYALGEALRKKDPLLKTEQFLSTEERSKLAGHANTPLAIMDLNQADLSGLLHQGKVNEFQHVQMDSTCTRLVASMGQAERIKNTVFPRMYRVVLHLAIYIFLTSLTISLSEIDIYAAMPVSFVIVLTFILLDRTAYQMQDPFEDRPTDTPMTTIARNIEINIKQTLGETGLPDPVKPEGFYLM